MIDGFPPRRHGDPPADADVEKLSDEQARRWLLDEAKRARAAVARAKAEIESRQLPPRERPTND